MKKIVCAHSPDPDDAFMFYALANKILDTGDYEFVDKLSDIETLNQEALKGTYEVTAISIHAYPFVAEKYALLTHGASMGFRYGPIVVTREPVESIKGKMIAVPGKLTSAYLELKLYEPDFEEVIMDFDKILEAVKDGKVDAGLIIHEGQLTYKDMGLHKFLDLGEWWYQETGLPIPLGGNAIRKDLGKEDMKKVSSLVKQSIVYAMEHEDKALEYSIKYGRDLNQDQNRKFVRMYVNDYTVDYGDDGRKAIKTLLEKAYEKGLIDRKVEVEFVE